MFTHEMFRSIMYQLKSSTPATWWEIINYINCLQPNIIMSQDLVQGQKNLQKKIQIYFIHEQYIWQ